MPLSKIIMFTGLSGVLLPLSTPALAHGDHAPAEGVLHAVAHFVLGMDQPTLFACAIGAMLLVVTVAKAVPHRKRANKKDKS